MTLEGNFSYGFQWFLLFTNKTVVFYKLHKNFEKRARFLLPNFYYQNILKIRHETFKNWRCLARNLLFTAYLAKSNQLLGYDELLNNKVKF